MLDPSNQNVCLMTSFKILVSNFNRHTFFFPLHFVMHLSLKINKLTVLFLGIQLPHRYPSYNCIANCQTHQTLIRETRRSISLSDQKLNFLSAKQSFSVICMTSQFPYQINVVSPYSLIIIIKSEYVENIVI